MLNPTAFRRGWLNYDADDELTQFGSPAIGLLTYNANGDRATSMASGIVTTFSYDYDDQLTGINYTQSGTAHSTAYQYDALGRQVRHFVNGVGTALFYDGDRVLYETTVTGAQTASYTWGNGLIRQNNVYPLTDGRGNTRLAMDAGKNITASVGYDAWGYQLGSTFNTPGPLAPYQWNAGSGYRADGDEASGFLALQKVGARYYDPEFGCFLTRDTNLSQKPFAYCDGDPVDFIDPDGQAPTHRFWYWAGVTLIVAAETAGTIAAGISGNGFGVALGVTTITGTILWAYGGDPGGPFFTSHKPVRRPVHSPVSTNEPRDPIKPTTGVYHGQQINGSYQQGSHSPSRRNY